ncbi:hypothetical protein [Methanoculleus bourgensis]|uniref:DUF86 domain-containing protein n=1 Tax=Methanoculleus bourgensis TaxID=83986 RepID=A0A0X3BPE2_9EURY|nr:hypothetical protein [Methanoculleus bourgensis]CVK33938.1 protein of unknown function [Methanoculleus bourgensis]
MVRDEGVLTHLRELDEAARDWERYRSITLDDLRTDRDKRNMVLHALLVSIQHRSISPTIWSRPRAPGGPKPTGRVSSSSVMRG